MLKHASRRQAGLGLVELMVSITIGLVILGALVALFVRSSDNNRELTKANVLIENGRAAIEALQSDVVHAGYWGQFVPEYDDQTFEDLPTDVPVAPVPDPCLGYSSANWDANYRRAMIAIPVQAYSATGATVCSAVIDYTKVVPGSDILVVRHAETCIPDEVIGGGNCEAVNADKLYVQTSTCGSDAARIVLGTTGFNLHKRDCLEDADMRRFTSSIYWLRTYAVTAGDGIPTLMRSTFELNVTTPAYTASVPLVQNVEQFMVELGIDSLSKSDSAVDYGAAIDWEDPDTHTTPTNRGDGSPDGAFVHCGNTGCTLAQLINVTAVTLHVLSRSPDESRNYTDTKTYELAGGSTATFNDRFKRRLFTHMIRLPNVSNRRQTP